MSHIDKWEEKRKRKKVRKDPPKLTHPHVPLTPAPAIPDSLTVGDLRVDGDLDLSFFDSLEPDQEFMIMPSAPTQDQVYTVNIDPVSGKQVVAATEPSVIAATTDGVAPASSPAATVYGSFRAIDVFWTAISNNDPVLYEVYIKTSTIDDSLTGATYVGSTAGTSAHITLIGGSLLATGTTYYVRIVAKDGDGSATPGTEGSASTLGGDLTAPASSPTPTVLGGPRQIFAHWSGVANTDVVTYDVHISTSSGFTPSAATKAFQTDGTFAVIEKVGSGLGGGALTYSTDYYVQIVARDVDGSAAASSEAGPVQLDQNAAADIAAGAITAAKLESLLVLATTIATASGTGARVVIDNSGVRVYNSSNTLIVELPIPGALNAVHSTPYFQGTMFAAGEGLLLDSDDSDVLTSTGLIRWRPGGTGNVTSYIHGYANVSGNQVFMNQVALGSTSDDSDWDGTFTLQVTDNQNVDNKTFFYFTTSGDDYDSDGNAQMWGQFNLGYFKSGGTGSRSGSDILLHHQHEGISDLEPIGKIVAFPTRFGPYDPEDVVSAADNQGQWLLCDGTEYFGNDYKQLYNVVAPYIDVCTLTIASPCVVTLNGVMNGREPLKVGDAIQIAGGTLPTGLNENTTYYVKALDPSGGGNDTFTISTSRGGAAVNTSGTQSGTHAVRYIPYGSTTNGYFNVPDLRSRVPVGADESNANTSSFTYVGATGGAVSVTLTKDNLPTHVHGVGTLANADESSHTHGNGSLGTSNATLNYRYRQNTVTTGSADVITSFEGQPGSAGTATSNVHSHNVTGTTAAGSAHTHTISGSTEDGSADSLAASAVSILPPYQSVFYFIKAKNTTSIYTNYQV